MHGIMCLHLVLRGSDAFDSMLVTDVYNVKNFDRTNQSEATG